MASAYVYVTLSERTVHVVGRCVNKRGAKSDAACDSVTRALRSPPVRLVSQERARELHDDSKES